MEVDHYEMQISIIQSNTELTPEQWINTYAERFRQIVTEHPEYTEFQVKHALYLMPYIQKRFDQILSL